MKNCGPDTRMIQEEDFDEGTFVEHVDEAADEARPVLGAPHPLSLTMMDEDEDEDEDEARWGSLLEPQASASLLASHGGSHLDAHGRLKHVFRDLDVVRKLHVLLHNFESRGLERTEWRMAVHRRESLAATVTPEDNLADLMTKEERSAFDWVHFGFSLFRLMLLPVYMLFYLLCTKRFRLSTRLSLIALSLLYLCTIALPLLGYLVLTHGELQNKGILFSPLIVYVVGALMVAGVDGMWKDPRKRVAALKKLTLLGTPTAPTAYDVVIAIKDKEQIVPTSTLQKLLLFGVPLLAGVGQGMLSYRIMLGLTWTRSVATNLLCIGCLVLNSLTLFLFLLAFGLSISVLVRQLTHVRLFSLITQGGRSAARHGLPEIPFSAPENIRAWLRIRDHVKSHTILPLNTASQVVSWSFLLTAFLVVFLTIQVFRDSTEVALLSPLNKLLGFVTIVQVLYLGAALIMGSKINQLLRKQNISLARSRLNMELRVHQMDREALECGRKMTSAEAGLQRMLLRCGRMLSITIDIMSKQDSAFQLVGLNFGVTTSRIVMALSAPLFIALTSRLISELNQ